MSYINRKTWMNANSDSKGVQKYRADPRQQQYGQPQQQYGQQQYGQQQFNQPQQQYGQQPQQRFTQPQPSQQRFTQPQPTNRAPILEANSTILNQVKQIKVEPQQEITGKFKTMSTEDIINLCYSTFKDIYKNRVKKTRIESIINGELITTNPNNIFINTTTFEDPGFEKKLQLITKKLYKYQIDALKMLRQLELSDEYITPSGERIRTNAYVLHLPVGCGKTIIFMSDVLIYRDVPAKPIIISTSGIHIPEDRMIQLKFYPYYYENIGYIVDSDGHSKENCVVAIKDYVQRKMSVVITHFHLIDQLIDYIHSDFVPGLYNPQVNKIVVATSPKQIDLNCNVLIVPAKPEIIERLSMLSCEQPFARVVVDDYTNMPNIEQYRQIRASSTIFVSGSGFERDIEKIPPSYYTLRHVEVDKFSLVANPEETFEGIKRNNVITFNLIGAQNEFSMYRFVNEIDEHCLNKYSMVASNIYDRINKGGKLLDYLNLNFILKNYDKLNKSISMILADIESGKLPKEKAGFLLEWKETINPTAKLIVSNQGKTAEKVVNNPLYLSLFKPINQAPQGIQPMLLMNCSVCGALPQQHKGWGFISSCCGSFFCDECAKAMCTRDLLIYSENDLSSGIRVHDDHHYYCTNCHKFDPTFVSNSTRHKDKTNIQTHHLVDEYMDNSDLQGHLHVDYYFKMFLEGFKPKYFNGKTIECEVESSIFNSVKAKFSDALRITQSADESVHGIIEQLIPKDQLALSCIERINECLKKLEIKPAKMNTIKPQLLVYGCPDYMQRRVEQYFRAYSSDPNENLYSLGIFFKNSLSELIGLHQNILGILVWNNPKHIDEIQQLIGRIVRLNNWNNPVYFYITCTGGVNEKGEAVENVNNADNVEEKKLGQETGRMVDIGGEIGSEGGEDMLNALKKMNSTKIPEIITEKDGLNFGF